ncbi:MAG: hypothetical protein IT539_13350 [Bradyrhizobiaceae bacterium]|nr:hypothetical protein [Bradyrhizobiaceae bacterium]
MVAVRASLISAALLVAATGPASAQTGPALVLSDLNLRAAPTTASPSLGVIPGGSTIDAGPCSYGWCQAFLGGQAGFVSESYLDFGGPRPRVYGAPPPPPPAVYGPPPVIYGPPPPPPYWGWRRW